jgi:shikimate dehydrogenase
MKCAVLGDPIAHSLSPVLHRAGYAAVGLDWDYDRVQVPAGGLADYVDSRDGDWRGLSVTMPLKREALEYAGAASDVARLAGVANTLVNDGDNVYAENTDVPGAAAAIRERYDGPLHSAVILGGGATAISVGLALAELGCADLTLLVRSPDRATEAARTIEQLVGPVSVAALDVREPMADIVVSTIPASAQTRELVASVAHIPVVFDVLYHPWPTALAASALGTGRVLVSGLDLLAHQAMLQFELFTGREVDVEVLRSAGKAALTAN